jgi:hypothetical protein
VALWQCPDARTHHDRYQAFISPGCSALCDCQCLCDSANFQCFNAHFTVHISCSPWIKPFSGSSRFNTHSLLRSRPFPKCRVSESGVGCRYRRSFSSGASAQESELRDVSGNDYFTYGISLHCSPKPIGLSRLRDRKRLPILRAEFHPKTR